jgi:hypothetical protein
MISSPLPPDTFTRWGCDGTAACWPGEGIWRGRSTFRPARSSSRRLRRAGITAWGFAATGNCICGVQHADGLTNVPPGITNVIAIAGRDIPPPDAVRGWYPGVSKFIDDPRRLLGLDDRARRTGRGKSTPISYQWQFSGRDIVGATSPILTLTNLTEALAGELHRGRLECFRPESPVVTWRSLSRVRRLFCRHWVETRIRPWGRDLPLARQSPTVPCP